jgi:hypothetical protein
MVDSADDVNRTSEIPANEGFLSLQTVPLTTLILSPSILFGSQTV